MKLVIIGRRRNGITLTESQTYQLTRHGPLVLEMIRRHPDIGPIRYVENHAFDGTYRAPGAGNGGFTENRDFITEVWFADPEHAVACQQSEFYRDTVSLDELQVVDSRTILKLPVAETVVLSSTGQELTTKLFMMLGAALDSDAGSLLSAWSDALPAMTALATYTGVQQHVRNEPLYGSGRASKIDCIDEYWFKNEENARKFAFDLLPFVVETLSKGSRKLMEPSNPFLLLTTEIVMLNKLGSTTR